jgi:hypothetical protein
LAFGELLGGSWPKAQPGDVVVVTKLDRLGRTASDILDTLKQFAKRSVWVIVIQFLGGQNIDMDSTVGRLVVIFFAGLAPCLADCFRLSYPALRRRYFALNLIVNVLSCRLFR